MVVERNVRRRHATAKPRHRTDLHRAGLVALELEPGLRLLARRHRRLHRHGQRLQRPLVGLLVLGGPRIAHHAVLGLVQRQHLAAVLQDGQHALLHLGRGHGPHGFVAPQVVEEKLAQPLLVDMRLGRAAFVELVIDTPVAFGRLVGPAEVRIAQVVLAQILPRAAQHHDLGTGRIQRLGGLRGQLHALLDGLNAHRLLLARAARVGRAARRGQRGGGERHHHALSNACLCLWHATTPDHRRSLCSSAVPIASGTKAITAPATDSTTPPVTRLHSTVVPTP